MLFKKFLGLLLISILALSTVSSINAGALSIHWSADAGAINPVYTGDSDRYISTVNPEYGMKSGDGLNFNVYFYDFHSSCFDHTNVVVDRENSNGNIYVADNVHLITIETFTGVYNTTSGEPFYGSNPGAGKAFVINDFARNPEDVLPELSFSNNTNSRLGGLNHYVCSTKGGLHFE
jgi:hypothetical protein